MTIVRTGTPLFRLYSIATGVLFACVNLAGTDTRSNPTMDNPAYQTIQDRMSNCVLVRGGPLHLNRSSDQKGKHGKRCRCDAGKSAFKSRA